MPKRGPPKELNIAQRNIASLIKADGLSVNAWAAKHTLVQSSINRIVTGVQDPTAGYLQQVASAVTAQGRPLEAWQLMAPDLGGGLFNVRISDDGSARVVPITVGAPRHAMREQRSPWTPKDMPPGKRKGSTK